MTVAARSSLIAIVTLATALLIGLLGAVLVLHEPPHAVAALARYLLLSGGLALGLGGVGVLLGMRFLPRLSLKVGLGYIIGSVAAMLTVLYTPLLMFREQADLHLLVLLLTSFLVISLGLAFIIGLGAAGQIQSLTQAVRHLQSGHFDTHVEVPSSDELADLAAAFNRMSAELGRAFERERAMEQSRRDLIAAISHDLRTPLASIRAMLEAIQDGVVADPETVARYHLRIHDEVGHLAHLIDDLFELSRLDAGQLQLDCAPVDLSELLCETLDSLSPRAHQHHVHLELAAGRETDSVLADPFQIQRVLVNLIENAIRHSREGGVVCVSARNDGNQVAVEVTDTGEGIPPTDIPHVFDRFFRGEKSRTRHSGGAGLGLAISKGIVEAHGGNIRVENRPETGARFIFTLPRA